MTDRELFQRARKALSSLTFPLLGTVLLSQLGRDVLPRTIFSAVFGKMEDIEQGMVPFLAFLGVWLLFAGVVDLLQLGAARLCLARGEGKEGAMPWIILPQWRQYVGWVLWTTFLAVFWQLGTQLATTWALRQADYRLLGRLIDLTGPLAVVSLLLTMLLTLSVQTAYLRAPERGFWRAVGFGLKEGLKKWPRTIGPQLKFVVPVSLGVNLTTVLRRKLTLRIGYYFGILKAYSLAVQLLGLLAEIWIMAFYGHLAADRYDPPDKGAGPEEKTKEEGPGCSM